MSSSISPGRNQKIRLRNLRTKANGTKTEIYRDDRSLKDNNSENFFHSRRKNYSKSFEGGIKYIKARGDFEENARYMLKDGYNDGDEESEDEDTIKTTIERTGSSQRTKPRNFIEIRPQWEMNEIQAKFEDFEKLKKIEEFSLLLQYKTAQKCLLALKDYTEEKKYMRKLLDKGFLFFKFRLLAKSFIGWKRTMNFRASMKNFLIKRLTRKKIKSKLLIFSILKENYRNVKRKQLNHSKAIGYHTRNRLFKTFKAWKSRTKKRLTLEEKGRILQEKQQMKLKKVSLIIWYEGFQQILDLKERETQLKEYLLLKKRREAFYTFMERAEEFQTEKNLEKRSNFFFSYWGAREFFKKAFDFVEIRKEQRQKHQIADFHYRQTVFRKIFYFLAQNAHNKRMLLEHAEILYFKNLMMKSLRSLRNYTGDQLSKIPLFSPRQIYIAHKYISVLDFDERKLESNKNNFLTQRLISTSRIRKTSFRKTLGINSGISESNSVILHEYPETGSHSKDRVEDLNSVIKEEEYEFEVEEEDEFSPEMYERNILEINSIETEEERFNRASGESEMEMVRSISRIDALYPKSERFYKQEQYEEKYTVPFYTERIRPKIYLRSNEVLEFALKEKYFFAFKKFAGMRKNFIRERKLRTLDGVFEALKLNCYENQNKRYLEEKADEFYARRRLVKTFGYMKFYLPKMRKLRILETEYLEIRRLRSNQKCLEVMLERFQDLKISQHNRELSTKYRRFNALRRSIVSWRMFVHHKIRCEENFKIIKEKNENNIMRSLIRSWRTYLPIHIKQRQQEEKINFFRKFTLGNKALLALKENWIEEINDRMLVTQFQEKWNFLKIEKLFFVLKNFSKESKVNRRKREICDQIYARNLVTKAMVSLYEYKNFQIEKKKFEIEKTEKIEKISRKIFLRKWNFLLFEKLRKRQFFLQMENIIKKVSFRKISELKKKDKKKILQFMDRRPEIMLKVCFEGLRRYREYSEKCRKNFHEIKKSKEERLTKFALENWKGEYKIQKEKYQNFIKTIKTKRKNYLVKKNLIFFIDCLLFSLEDKSRKKENSCRV